MMMIMDAMSSSEKCWQITENIMKCTQEVSENWSCIIQLTYDGHNQSSNKRILMNCGHNEAMICCPIWNFIDCLRDLCLNSKLISSIFMADIQKIHRHHCQHFQYDSQGCKQYERFVRNPFLLDPFDHDDIMMMNVAEKSDQTNRSILHYKNNDNNDSFDDLNRTSLAPMSLPQFTTKMTIKNKKLLSDFLRTIRYLLFWIAIYSSIIIFGPFIWNDPSSSTDDINE